MRSLTGQDTAVLKAPDGYDVAVRVWVYNGSAYQDVTSLEGRNWLVEVAWDESINEPCAQCTVQLRRRLEDLSLNPLVSNKLTGVLALGRAFYVEAATLPAGDPAQSGDWRTVFSGQIETLALDKDPLTFTGRDDAGKLLRGYYIETERPYGSTGGTATETVIQSILTDNGTGVTLYVPTATGTVLTPFKQKKAPVLTAIRELALKIGWDVRMFWDNGTGTFRLTLLKPDRTGTAGSQWAFQPSAVRNVTAMKQDLNDIRNAVTLWYYNRDVLDAGGKATLSSVTSTDATSISTYGRQFMQLAEDETSPIDSAAEAQRMADAARDDLKDPLLSFGVEVGFHYGVQLNDLVTFVADGSTYFSSDQTLAVVSAAHRIGVKGHSSTLELRGKPVGASDDWLRRDGRIRPQPPASQPDAVGSLTVSSTASGAVVSFTAPTVPPIPVEYELHLSTTSGFTPSTATLKERAARTNFNLNGLTPGVTYYLRVVPRDDVGNRGVASSELSVTPRYVAPLDTQPAVAFGTLPPNGDFEANNTSGAPPDTWTVERGTWGVDVSLSSTSYAGSSSLRIAANSNSALTGRIYSQRMTVRPGEKYTIDVISNRLGTSGSQMFATVRYYADLSTTVLSSDTLLITPGANSWVRAIQTSTAPSTAKYVDIRLGTATSTDDLLIDSIDFRRSSLAQEAWTNVSANGYYANGWTDYGGGYGSPAFRINSLGNLELMGMAKCPTPAPSSGATVFTLPANYRPSVTKLVRLNFPVTGDSDLQIFTDGRVTIQSATAGQYLPLDGISVPLT